MKRLLAAGLVLALPACGGDVVSDPSQWSCEALIAPVIALSEERSVKILEITNVQEQSRFSGSDPSIACNGWAEWSEGGDGGAARRV